MMIWLNVGCIMLHQSKRSKQSKSDDWWTPKEVYDKLCKKYGAHPELDVAADYKNSLCEFWINKRKDALKTTWKLNGLGNDVFCNPPNSIMGKFLQKAFLEYIKHRGNVRIMMILPTNIMSSNSWFGNVEDQKKLYDIFYEPIKGRIRFLHKGKPGTHVSINAYLVVLFGFKGNVFLLE